MEGGATEAGGAAQTTYLNSRKQSENFETYSEFSLAIELSMSFHPYHKIPVTGLIPDESPSRSRSQ